MDQNKSIKDNHTCQYRGKNPYCVICCKKKSAKIQIKKAIIKKEIKKIEEKPQSTGFKAYCERFGIKKLKL